MFTGIYQSAVILATAIAYYVVDFRLIHRFDPLRASGTSRAWDYTIMAVIGGSFVAVQPLVLPWIGIHTDAWWGMLVQGAGTALTVAGLALTRWARIHLAQFFGERVEFQPDQYLIDTGPYAYVRHPIYSSFFMIAVGLLLINPSLTTLLVAIYIFADFIHITPGEEKLLAEKIPGYAEYMTRTGRFFPRLGKSPTGQ